MIDCCRIDHGRLSSYGLGGDEADRYHLAIFYILLHTTFVAITGFPLVWVETQGRNERALRWCDNSIHMTELAGNDDSWRIVRLFRRKVQYQVPGTRLSIMFGCSRTKLMSIETIPVRALKELDRKTVLLWPVTTLSWYSSRLVQSRFC